MWIAEIDDGDGGLLQSYLHVDYAEHNERVGIAEAVGIDYLIAGPHRGRGRGRLVLRAFADWTLTHDRDASCCVASGANLRGQFADREMLVLVLGRRDNDQWMLWEGLAP